MKMRNCLLIALIQSNLVFAGSVIEEISANKHMGVASCSNSVCHGASQPFRESNVMQNEFAIWQEFDPHAKAYQTLLSKQSAAIANKLRIGPAHEAKICLDCHADNIAVEQRGERFQISDGVGCEACHGGSEKWLSSHADKSVSHAQNLSQGLFATEDPLQRAQLCLSCHMGNADRMISHRIMGAGHPRLAFELDTFTWLNPHYEADQDYIDRKGEFNGLRDWGVGQGVSASNQLSLLLDAKVAWQGIFPELVLFDCHACHKPMSANSWVARSGTGLGPGVVRLNDAHLVMFRHVLAAVDKSLAEKILVQTRELHRATTTDRDKTQQAAKALQASLQSALLKVSAHSFSGETLSTILASLEQDAVRGEFRDFAAAEQAAMAVQSVIVAFESAGKLDESQIVQLQAKVDALYATVAKEDQFSLPPFLAALRGVRAAVP